MSPAPYTSLTFVSPFELIIRPNLSHSIPLSFKNPIFDLTPVHAIINSQGTSSPVFNFMENGLLLLSTITFSALTPNLKSTPSSHNLSSYTPAAYLSN